MKRMVFLTPGASAPGFRMAGVSQPEIEETDLARLVLALDSDPETGLVVIDERLLTLLPPELLPELEERGRTLAAILPAPEQEEAADYALELIRRAIGYHVRLRP